jgi:hypothetical protein
VPAAQLVRFRLILNELVCQRAYGPLRQELTRYRRDGRKCGSNKQERGMQQTLSVQPMSRPVNGRGTFIPAIMVSPGQIYGQAVKHSEMSE